VVPLGLLLTALLIAMRLILQGTPRPGVVPPDDERR
jgi:hypothetical protein